ncbi:MAG TPA: NAD-dependent epimerase/dehydratase family protein [Candidatus Thermoplasmatota archaeon]|nr:NAD-dependent epimerase/dehydratase family protein [Candidatus Thermoplasmatota archaeon]
MKLVTGGAGFIGSHLVDAFVARGEEVVVVDDLSTGNKRFLKAALASKRVRFVKGDCGNAADMKRALKGVDEVWHMAADPDVRAGETKPWSNFRDGAVLTFRVLDAMRRADVSKFVYASSSTVYGEADVRPTPEDYGPLVPISMYGASKLAGEAVVGAFVGTFGMQGWVFRFGNVVGPRLTHGVIFDFHGRLRKDPKRLAILGNGKQDKAYLSTQDCVEGMIHGRARAKEPYNVFNLASDATINVVRIAELVVEAMGLRGVRFEFTGGDRGWKGDVPIMALGIKKMRALGWTPRHTSEDAVRMAAESVVSERRLP